MQKFDNFTVNFLNEKNKTNSGMIKWMDIQIHNTMTECLESIKKNYEPIYVCTDISEKSRDILELKELIKNDVKFYMEEDIEKSRKILNDIMFVDQLKKERINYLKEKMKDEQSLKFENFGTNEKFIQNLFIKGYFLNEKLIENTTSKINRTNYHLYNEEKQKILVIVFGNESRGVSNFIKRNSNHHLVIPHFGPKDSSYNLSVSCGMILFYLFSSGVLPGSFNDFHPEKASDILAKYLLDSFKKFSRSDLSKLGISQDLEDY